MHACQLDLPLRSQLQLFVQRYYQHLERLSSEIANDNTCPLNAQLYEQARQQNELTGSITPLGWVGCQPFSIFLLSTHHLGPAPCQVGSLPSIKVRYDSSEALFLRKALNPRFAPHRAILRQSVNPGAL